MKETDSVLSGTLWALAARIVIASSGLLSAALLARLLVPADLGRYLLLASVTTIAATVALAGINQAVVRLVAEAQAKHDNDGAGGYARTALMLGTVTAAATGAAVAFSLDLLLKSFEVPAVTSGVRVLIGGWVVLLAFQNLVAECIRGFRQIGRAAIVGGGLQGAATASVLAFWWASNLSFGLTHLLGVVLFALVLGGLYGVCSLWPMIRRSDRASIRKVRETVRIAPSLWLTSILLTILAQMDVWIVAKTGSADVVAVYGAAARLVAAVALPLIVANAVIPPFISEYFVRDERAALQSMIRTIATLTAIPAGLALLSFMFFGRAVLSLVYGPAYAGGSTILGLLSIGQVINVLSGSCGLTLMMTGSERLMLLITALTSAAGVVAAMSLNLLFGAEGIAAAMALAMIIQNLLMVLAVRARIGIWTFVGIPEFSLLHVIASKRDARN